MTNGQKVGAYIGGAAVFGLAWYFVYIKMAEAKAKKEAEANANATTPNTGGTVKNTSAPKINVPTPVTVTTPGFSTVASPPKIGSKAFAAAGGANAYKTASAGQTNIYKYYPANAYIGTFLAKEGIYTKLIVEETGIFTNTNKTVWVLSTNIKY